MTEDRQEVIRQILRDLKNALPHGSYGDQGLPIYTSRLKPTKANHSLDLMAKACVVFRAINPILYTAVHKVYLHDGAGDRDLDFFKSRPLYDELVGSEARAIKWLVKFLDGIPLTAKFPDTYRNRPLRTGDLSERYAKITAYYHSLLADNMKPTKAMEETASMFGYSESTVKRAVRFEKAKNLPTNQE